MSEPIHGACLCGKVTFEVTNAEVMGACHCTRCQRWTGSANSMVVVSDPKDLEITSGNELLKRFHEEGFADRYFCANCGSGIYVDGGEKVYVGAGGMKGLNLKPTFHIQVAYKAPWEEIGGSAPQFPEFPPRS